MNQGMGGNFKKAVLMIHGSSGVGYFAPKEANSRNVNFLIFLQCSVSCCASLKRGTIVPLEIKSWSNYRIPSELSNRNEISDRVRKN